MLDIIEANECTPSLSQAQRMKQAAQEGKLDRNGMELVMQEEKPQQNNITIKSDKLSKYFRKDATPREKEELIIKALDYYCKVQERKRQEREHERKRLLLRERKREICRRTSCSMNSVFHQGSNPPFHI